MSEWQTVPKQITNEMSIAGHKAAEQYHGAPILESFMPVAWTAALAAAPPAPVPSGWPPEVTPEAVKAARATLPHSANVHLVDLQRAIKAALALLPVPTALVGTTDEQALQVATWRREAKEFLRANTDEKSRIWALRFLGVAALLSPIPGPVGTETDEEGWLIERADSNPAEPWYWAAGQREAERSSAWTQNHMAAIRLARKEDAEAVVGRIMKGIGVRIAQHGWIPGSTWRDIHRQSPSLPVKATSASDTAGGTAPATDAQIAEWKALARRVRYPNVDPAGMRALHKEAANALDALIAQLEQRGTAVPMADSIVEAVCADLRERSRRGIAKYGTTLDRTDLNQRDWLQHAYEEALDLANYLKRSVGLASGTALPDAVARARHHLRTALFAMDREEWGRPDDVEDARTAMREALAALSTTESQTTPERET